MTKYEKMMMEDLKHEKSNATLVIRNIDPHSIFLRIVSIKTHHGDFLMVADESILGINHTATTSLIWIVELGIIVSDRRMVS